MSQALRSTVFAMCLAVLPSGMLFAQDNDTEIDPTDVLATVNGKEITLGHIITLRRDLPPQYSQFPPELLFRGILDQLIQHELLMQSMEDDLLFANRVKLENEARAIHASQVINEIVSAGPSEEELQALYDEQYPVDLDQVEYRASHILVDSEELAKSLIDEIANGADFAAVARENSTGPSGEVGGDLGWFGEGDMVQPFFEAVSSLEPGEMSEPVKTEFGWHVITLAETRDKQRPALEVVQQELESQFRQNALDAHVAKLREKAEVEEVDIEQFDPSIISEFEALEN